MVLRAERLLPQLEKVERLLGHTFSITKEILVERVEAAINRESRRHQLNVRELDPSKVDWTDLISRSVRRQPPFDPGEKEKGFRDAVVLETFYQLIDVLPKSPQSCRIVLMTGDRLLTDAAQAKTNDRSNVAYTGELEEVRTMLNALASQLTQEMISKILPLASDLFLKTGSGEGVYYQGRIAERITNDFGAQLNSVPEEGFTNPTTQKILISVPTFLTKNGQRLTFSSRVSFNVEVVKVVWRPAPAGSDSANSAIFPSGGIGLGAFGAGPSVLGSGAFHSNSPGLFSVTGITGHSGNPGGLAGQINPGAGVLGGPPFMAPPQPPSIPPTREEIRREGRHVFEVTWSAILTAAGQLTRAKTQKVEFKSTAWSE